MQIYEEEGKLVIQPSGSIRSDNAAEMETEIRKAAAEHPRLPLVIDARGITYISSSGLRVLLAIEQTMEDRDGGLTLRHVNENIIEIFNLVGFMDVVKVEMD